MTAPLRVGVYGAGSIGGYVGARLLAAEAADVVLLQEIGPHAVDGARAGAVADALGLGYACAHDLAILCRWPLRDVHVMELPHARLPYNRRRRLALSAMIDHAAGPLREAVARALDPESLAMALARAGRLSPAHVGWAEAV